MQTTACVIFKICVEKKDTLLLVKIPQNSPTSSRWNSQHKCIQMITITVWSFCLKYFNKTDHLTTSSSQTSPLFPYCGLTQIFMTPLMVFIILLFIIIYIIWKPQGHLNNQLLITAKLFVLSKAFLLRQN